MKFMLDRQFVNSQHLSHNSNLKKKIF
uniref:Uncharacterized protein n=1 Tax=Anguilla anguilla TaxID=7936 RepID=A0A0E9VAD2_ANGAN